MKHFILLLFIGLMASATTVAQSDTSENWDKVFVKVEKEAVFPGGAKGWSEYLAKNLNVNTAVDAGAKAGVYTVKVQFLVGADGNHYKGRSN